MELKKPIEITDVFNNESLLEEFIKLPFKADTHKSRFRPYPVIRQSKLAGCNIP